MGRLWVLIAFKSYCWDHVFLMWPCSSSLT